MSSKRVLMSSKRCALDVLEACVDVLEALVNGFEAPIDGSEARLHQLLLGVEALLHGLALVLERLFHSGNALQQLRWRDELRSSLDQHLVQIDLYVVDDLLEVRRCKRHQKIPCTQGR